MIDRVTQIAGQGKVHAGAALLVRIARHHDLAIAVDGEAVGLVVRGAEVGGDLPITSKGRIEAAVAVIAGQCKVPGAARLGRTTRHHDLAIRLDGDAPGLVVRAGEVGGDLPINIEGRVQAAVAVVAGQGEVIGAEAIARTTRHHDLAIGLDGDAVGIV